MFNSCLECKDEKSISKNYGMVGNNIRQFGKDLTNRRLNDNFEVKNPDDKNTINQNGSINSKNSGKPRNSYMSNININPNQVSIFN